MATIKVKRGSGAPSGLTAGEPAFDTTNNALYVHNGTAEKWIGAEVDNGTLTTNSQIKIPTQYAVKQYVDGFVAGGAVVSINGETGAISLLEGTGIDIAVDTGNKNITLTNIGVQSVSGTPNEISVTGSTGSVTFSLPSSLIAPGSLEVTTNLTVSGNLTVNGTTTTVNSNVTTVDDPMLMIGTSGGVPIAADDGGKDRGIAFTYYTDAGYTGFFGFDDTDGRFKFIPNASITSDVVTSGSVGEALFKSLFLTTDGTNLGGLTLATLDANRTYTLPNHSGTVVVPSDLGTNNYILKASGAAAQPTWVAQSTLAVGSAATLTTARTIGITGDIDGTATSFNGSSDITISTTIPSGSVENAQLANSSVTIGSTPVSLGGTITEITGLSGVTATNFYGSLVGNASTATTATNANNVAVAASTDTTAFITFVETASDSNQGIKYDSDLQYNATTGTLTTTTFAGALSGNASTATDATNATNVAVASSTDSTSFLAFIETASNGNQGIKYNSGLQYNATDNILTVTKVEAIVDGGSY